MRNPDVPKSFRKDKLVSVILAHCKCPTHKAFFLSVDCCVVLHAYERSLNSSVVISVIQNQLLNWIVKPNEIVNQ